MADPQMPSDPSMTEVVGNFDDEGFAAQFVPVADARLRCSECGHTFPAAGRSADQIRRLEGVSDPADSSMVIPLSCPRCAADGLLTVKYGPEASEEETDVVLALGRTPQEGSGGLPPPGVG